MTDHEDDHGHRDDPQQGHVPPRQQGGAGQDAGGVDAGQPAVHEGDPCSNMEQQKSSGTVQRFKA